MRSPVLATKRTISMRQAYESSSSSPIVTNKRNRHIEEQPISPILPVITPFNNDTQNDPPPALGITSSPHPQRSHYQATEMTNQEIDLVFIAKKRGRPAQYSRAGASCTDDPNSCNLDAVQSAQVTRLHARK